MNEEQKKKSIEREIETRISEEQIKLLNSIKKHFIEYIENAIYHENKYLESIRGGRK